MSLYKKMSTVQSTNPYFKKDLQKTLNANKFIGRGSIASSTNKYMLAAGELANCGSYESSDVIFISAEGMRKGRLNIDFDEIQKAINSRATFITDDFYNRNRSYNLGEREVAQFLEKNNYYDTGKGIWKFKE